MLRQSGGLLRGITASSRKSHNLRLQTQLPQRLAPSSVVSQSSREQRRSVMTEQSSSTMDTKGSVSVWLREDYASLPSLLAPELGEISGNDAAVTDAQVANLLPKLEQGWHMAPFAGSGDLKVLQRRYEFKGYKHAKNFFAHVAKLAMKTKHHPECIVGWGHCTVAFWTHFKGEVRIVDFVCAARVDELARELEYEDGRIKEEPKATDGAAAT